MEIAEQDKRATFVVEVQFDRNNSWQGIIRWLEEKKTRKFRSELELLHLMDEAMRGKRTYPEHSAGQE